MAHHDTFETEDFETLLDAAFDEGTNEKTQKRAKKAAKAIAIAVLGGFMRGVVALEQIAKNTQR